MDRHGKKAKATTASQNSERSDLKSAHRTQWGEPTEAARAAAADRDGSGRDDAAKARRGGGRTSK